MATGDPRTDVRPEELRALADRQDIHWMGGVRQALLSAAATLEAGSLNLLASRIHAWAKSKGWWDEDAAKSFGECIALIHSEASEALEEFRDRHEPTEVYYRASQSRAVWAPEEAVVSSPEEMVFDRGQPFPAHEIYNDLKPEGIPIEFADIIIRVLDLAGFYGIDIDAAVAMKMRYNEGRPYRHGGKAL